MPRIELVTRIAAPIAHVFDLARDIDLHQRSQKAHEEKAVAGRTSGRIQLGEEVTWEAVHLGRRQRLTSRIVALEKPFHFRDAMVTGAFQRFDHDHFFAVAADGSTRMTDVFDYTSPWRVLGKLADFLFLKGYLRRLLEERNSRLKEEAEKG